LQIEVLWLQKFRKQKLVKIYICKSKVKLSRYMTYWHMRGEGVYIAPPVSTGQEAGWAPEPVWTQRLEEKSSASVGDRTPIVQFVASDYTELPRLLRYICNESKTDISTCASVKLSYLYLS
jgi:hypothetical protein